jgi:hypothetical protein
MNANQREKDRQPRLDIFRRTEEGDPQLAGPPPWTREMSNFTVAGNADNKDVPISV